MVDYCPQPGEYEFRYFYIGGGQLFIFYRQRHKEDLNAFKQFNIIAYKFFVPKYEAALFSDLDSYHTFFCTILIYMFTYFNRLNFNRRFHEHIYIFCKGCSKIQIFQLGTSHYFSSLDDSILFS